MNSSSDDDAANVAFYEDLVARYGYNFRALNRGSAQSQEGRFAILAGIAPLAGTRLLDVGCGLGDFRLWLLCHGIAVDYHGIDIAPRMVEAAKNRQPDAVFLVYNSLRRTQGRSPLRLRARERHFLLPKERTVGVHAAHG